MSLLVTSPAYAARQRAPAALTGNDISWPQCGKVLPSNQAFGIVGVNGGTAANTNPCLATQLQWAHRSSGGTTQPKAQLYVNTANPGQVMDQITTWPKSNADKNGFVTANPYGPCGGQNDLACSWQYGWNRAVEALQDRFQPAAVSAAVNSEPSAYTWWLDVETVNTWQSGSTQAQAKNTAALEGMTSFYQLRGAKVGLYSTGYQWSQIVGKTVSSSSNLNGLDSWLAGAKSLRGAQANCNNPPLTFGGKVTLAQYVSGSLDYDYPCYK